MKSITLLLISILSVFQVFGQMVMTKKGITPENVCHPDSIYYFLPEKPHPLESRDSIKIRLNTIVPFAKQNPEFKGNPSIQLAINCKGENGGGFNIISSSGNSDLDTALINFLKTINNWKPGKLKEGNVDSWFLWNIMINNGIIEIMNRW